MHRNAQEAQVLNFQNNFYSASACDEIMMEIESRKYLWKSNFEEINVIWQTSQENLFV